MGDFTSKYLGLGIHLQPFDFKIEIPILFMDDGVFFNSVFKFHFFRFHCSILYV